MLGTRVGLTFKNKVQFPVTPLHSAQLGFDIKKKTFARRFFNKTFPPTQLAKPINGPVSGRFCTGNFNQGGKQVGDMHDVVAHASFVNVARPFNNQRHAQSAFHGGVVSARPRASGAAPWTSKLRTVVAGKNEQGVVFNAKGLDSIHQLPNAIVHLHHGICKFANATFSSKVGVCKSWEMQMREGHIQKKWFVAICFSTHEVNRFFGELTVNQAAFF